MGRFVTRFRVLIPRVTLCRWGGCDSDGLFDYEGRSLSVEWLGLIAELCLGRRR